MKSLKTLVLASAVAVAFSISAVGTANATPILFDLEGIGADGAIVSSITSGGVTITLAPTIGDFQACTYNDATSFCFAGAGTNVPLVAANVSGTRFISTFNRLGTATLIDDAIPITFTFSTPVKGFGFTTLDLLESGGSPGNTSITMTLSGDGGSTTHALTGAQGASGIDIDWYISSAVADITSATYTVSGGTVYGGAYGMDDFFVELADVPEQTSVPEPTTLALFGTGLIGFAALRRRRKAKA